MIIQSNHLPTNHIPQYHIYTFLQCFQRQCLLPGQPVPVPNCSFLEDVFPNIQSEPPLVQLEDIPSCATTVTWEKRLTPHLITTSFQIAIESNKAPEPPPDYTIPIAFPCLEVRGNGVSLARLCLAVALCKNWAPLCNNYICTSVSLCMLYLYLHEIY